jgi:hypothetical protein
MKPLTARDLDTAYSRAKQAYVDTDRGVLTEKEFLAKCWFIALAPYLREPVVLPVREQPEPEDY